MIYIYVEASWFVDVVDYVEFFDDIVCAPLNKIFWCEEVDLG